MLTITTGQIIVNSKLLCKLFDPQLTYRRETLASALNVELREANHPDRSRPQALGLLHDPRRSAPAVSRH